MHDRPLKILYLITKSNFGGAQKYVFELAKEAKERGHEVSVAVGGTGEAGAAPGLLVQKLTDQNITVHPIRHFMRDVSWWHDMAAGFEILQLLRSQRPDVLHISSSKAGAIGTLAGRIIRVPKIIYTIHGFADDESWRPRWQQLLIRLITLFTISLSHFSITISSEAERKATSLPRVGHKIVCIKNGVSMINFLDRTTARNILVPHLPADTFLIGGIGELHPNKNWGVLIHALESLPKSIHLLIIGTGQEKEQLTRLATQLGVLERVHLVGYQTDAARFLSAFDVFTLSSVKEGLPYVILEAGLAKLPVIASDLPGTRDIIETGMQGLLVEPTKKLFCTSLEVLCRDEGMRRRLGEALFTRVQQDYTLKETLDKTFALYASKIE